MAAKLTDNKTEFCHSDDQREKEYLEIPHCAYLDDILLMTHVLPVILSVAKNLYFNVNL